MFAKQRRNKTNETIVKRDRGCQMVYFRTKIPLKVYFVGLVVEYVGIIYDQLVHFTSIWYILWSFCVFFLVSV
jgi:hypothetical protein